MRRCRQDLTDWIAGSKADEYYGLDFNKDADGRYWGVPQGIQVGVLFCNKELFDKAGVAYPTDEWTWEDLKASACTVDAGGRGQRV